MASFDKLPAGYWRAQVRLKSEAEAWAIDAERAVQAGKSPDAVQIDAKTLFGTLVDLHIADLAEVGKSLLRSKAMCLEKLRRELGRERLSNITRERLIGFGKQRAREGAGPITLSIDLGYIRTILVHAAAVHGVEVPTEHVTCCPALLSGGWVFSANHSARPSGAHAGSLASKTSTSTTCATVPPANCSSGLREPLSFERTRSDNVKPACVSPVR